MTLESTLLAKDEFYSYSKVEIIYIARLDENAVVGSESGNINQAKLTFTNAFEVPSDSSSEVYKVYTYQIPVACVDGNTNKKITASGAEFTLYTDADCTTLATNGSATSSTDGVGILKGLKAGTYYLKQTKAPKGYNLNASVITVVISENGTITANESSAEQITVKNYPLTVPETGEKGTIMFTISGLVLMLGAGVLFLVFMRKKQLDN